MEPIEFCKRLDMYIEENPEHCDIKFLVGPHREIIKTLRSVLEVASPVFGQLFDKCWDEFIANSNIDDQIGIPLPDVDPIAFRVFLKLLLTSDVSEESVKTLNFDSLLVLNVMELCKRFGLPSMHKKLQSLAGQSLFSKLTKYVQSDEFLEVSQKTLKTILSRDEIALDEKEIFDIVYNWAVYQCDLNGVKNVTMENIRTMLGDCLQEIRFPSMSFMDFGKLTRSKNILTIDEQIEVFHYISLRNEYEDGLSQQVPYTRFNTRKRALNFAPSISFLKQFKASDDPPFEWDDQQCCAHFQADHKVYLTSFGFLGPVDYDGYYDCHLEVLRYKSNYSVSTCAEVTQRVFARQRQVFYIKLNDPILIEPTASAKSLAWNKYYGVRYSFKGPKTQTLKISEEDTKSRPCFKSEADGVTFFCQWSTGPFVELQFRVD